MSSLTAVSTGFGPAFEPSIRAQRVRRTSARRRHVRLTGRGRVVVVLAFLAFAGVLMTTFGGLATATREAGTPEPVRIIEVGPGDTLYGIAGTVAEPGHIRETVAHIEQLNSLSGPELTVGQRLAVPRG